MEDESLSNVVIRVFKTYVVIYIVLAIVMFATDILGANP